MIRFLTYFYEVRSLILWDFNSLLKYVSKTFVFDTLNYERIILAYVSVWIANAIISFYSSSKETAQKAVASVKGIGAYYRFILFSLFGLPYVGCIYSSMDFWNLSKSWLPKSIIRLYTTIAKKKAYHLVTGKMPLYKHPLFYIC